MNYRTAVILCGGKGTRLGLIGRKLPKTLVKIQNFPIIWYIINSLKKNSINHFILPVGYKGNKIKRYFEKNNNFDDLKIDIISTGDDTPIAKRIFKIKNKIISKDFLLLNGDAIFDFNIKKILKMHIKKKIDITFLGTKVQLPFGVVKFRKKKIVDFKRDTEFDTISYSREKSFISKIYSGICILKKKTLNLNFRNYKNFEKEFYPKLIKKSNSEFKDIKGPWFSIDNNKDIISLNSKKNNFNYKTINKIKKNFKK